MRYLSKYTFDLFVCNAYRILFNFNCRLGGPDPLDYISMYWNPGRVDINVPPHWHYVR